MGCGNGLDHVIADEGIFYICSRIGVIQEYNPDPSLGIAGAETLEIPADQAVTVLVKIKQDGSFIPCFLNEDQIVRSDFGHDSLRELAVVGRVDRHLTVGSYARHTHQNEDRRERGDPQAPWQTEQANREQQKKIGASKEQS